LAGTIPVLAVPEKSIKNVVGPNMELDTPLEEIKRIGSFFKKKLEKLRIFTIEDLLYHFPHRYEDLSSLTSIAKAKVGEKVFLRGKIVEIRGLKSLKRKIFLTKALVKDDSGMLEVIWYHQPYLTKTLKKGDELYLAGKLTWKKGRVFLSNPIFERAETNKELIHTGRIVPVYPETRGLSSRWFRKIFYFLLKKQKLKIEEILPSFLLRKEGLMERKRALFEIHFPSSLERAKSARERFSFEKLFLLQLKILSERKKLKKEKAFKIETDKKLLSSFIKSLPFELTLAQKKALVEILKDLRKESPMNRLLQGDTGSGKTVCAMYAILQTAKQNLQSVLMVPTEILAKQHFQAFLRFLKNFETRIGLLTSKEAQVFSLFYSLKISKEKMIKKIENGEIKILIGTHALLNEKISFQNLALVVLDEQHRFGVEQRAKLIKHSKERKKANFLPHFLSMTATPIPRTLALAFYGDLDFSILDEMPKGRQKVETKIVLPRERDKVYAFVREEIKRGKQIFVICPRIEGSQDDSEREEIKAVEKEFEKISKEIFPEFKCAMLHGKMKGKEKERVMKDMFEKKIDILVSTSVVEVGIDIPGATIILIEGAESFGLAQLHQLRGRVGRREEKGFCFLFLEKFSEKAYKRLKALLESENGLQLAEKDLKIRGPGEFLGQRQWGIPDVAMKALTNESLVKKAKERAKEILERDPELENYPLLKQKLEKMKEIVHLE
jgi:ATP-dependent DNA helicase RecG